MTILYADRRARSDAELEIREKTSADFASKLAEPQYAPELRLEPVHLDMDLRVDLERQRLEAVVTHTVRCNDAGASALVLHGVELGDLRAEGDGVVWDYDGQELHLAWEQPFDAHEERRVTLRYLVQEPRSGLFFSKPSEHAPEAPLFAVTDHETERARHWLCTVDLPAVRPTLRFRIRADASLTILANGTLQGEEIHEDGTKTATWVLGHPCPSYLTCFAVGDFVRWDSEPVGGVPIAAFASRARFDEAHLERSFRRTADMLRWLPRRLGAAFPYPKYFQFAVPGIGGAMENISLVSWDDRFLLDEALETEERQLMDAINLHEMAHSWFGNHVVCRDYAHAWLKESWATYMETCWLEHDLGKEAADYDLWVNAQNYFRESNERYRRPIVTRRFDSSWDMYDYHLYPGGAWRLHMLRKMLGEEVFWRAVQRYLCTFGGNVVETDDFRRVLEEESGRSLERFFDQWLRSPGHPKLKGRFTWRATAKEGCFEIEQTQRDDKTGVPIFAFDLDLAYWIDGERYVRKVRFDREKLSCVVPMERSPDRVRVDPDLRVLHELTFEVGDERLRAQLRDDDVWGRILAGRALAATGKRTHIEAIAEQLRRDPHWGVQTQLAEVLGRAQTDSAVRVLSELVADHAEPRSLAALFRAAGRYRDPRLGEALRARVEAGRLPPRALEAAHEALGAQREDAPIELLSEASGREGFGGFGQGGALRGLGATRQKAALELLLTRTRAGAVPFTVRPHAVGALGILARTLDEPERERATEALIDLLRDPAPKVRWAAALALCTAKARRAAGAVEAYAATLTHQEEVRLRRKIRALRRGRGGVRQAEQRLEELEAKLRKLSDRLEKLESQA